CYMVASVFMLTANILVSRSPSALTLICGTSEVCLSWEVPSYMILPLLYWIVFASVFGYFLIFWANQHAKATVVGAYAVLQPVTAGLLSSILLNTMGERWAADHGLQGLGMKDLGVIPICLGLYCIFSEPILQEKDRLRDLKSLDLTGAGKEVQL
ncbi:unnamed protein product, partial [Polarella glacialis]